MSFHAPSFSHGRRGVGPTKPSRASAITEEGSALKCNCSTSVPFEACPILAACLGAYGGALYPNRFRFDWFETLYPAAVRNSLCKESISRLPIHKQRKHKPGRLIDNAAIGHCLRILCGWSIFIRFGESHNLPAVSR